MRKICPRKSPKNIPKGPPKSPQTIPKSIPNFYVFYIFYDFRGFFGDFLAYKSTFEPITGLRHYSSWIRLVFLCRFVSSIRFFAY